MGFRAEVTETPIDLPGLIQEGHGVDREQDPLAIRPFDRMAYIVHRPAGAHHLPK